MTSLAQAIKSFNTAAVFNTPPHWQQGRTIYGGLSAALALQAALRDGPPDLPPLKSAQVLFVGPALEGLSFKVHVLRQGKSVTLVSVDAMSGPDLVLRVAFVFAQARPSAHGHDFTTAPMVKPPEHCMDLHATGRTPIHLSNFEIRMASEALPVTGAQTPEFIAWVRHRDAAGVDPAVALMAVGDSLPPGVMACFTEFAPISSMTWSLDIARPVRADGWYLMRSSSQRARGGYSYQSMDIWDDEGQLVLSGSQTVAVFA
jgi:acyl-CoA thioesterase